MLYCPFPSSSLKLKLSHLPNHCPELSELSILPNILRIPHRLGLFWYACLYCICSKQTSLECQPVTYFTGRQVTSALRHCPCAGASWLVRMRSHLVSPVVNLQLLILLLEVLPEKQEAAVFNTGSTSAPNKHFYRCESGNGQEGSSPLVFPRRHLENCKDTILEWILDQSIIYIIKGGPKDL